MKRFVLDASVALAWFLDRPTPKYATHVRELLENSNRGVVPLLWSLEMANGFAVSERRGMLTASDTAEALRELDIVAADSIEVSHETISLRSALHAAREFRLTAYDAVYLETALREHLPLATLDKQLLRAASEARVDILS